MKRARITFVFFMLVFSVSSQQKSSDIAKLSARMDSLNRVCLSQQREIESLKIIVQSQKTELVNTTKAQNAETEVRIKKLENTIKELTGSPFSSFEIDNLKDLTSKVKKLESKIGEMQGSSHSFNQPNISDLSKKISDLETRVYKISGSYIGVSQPNISDLKKQIENLESKIGDLERNMNDLERKIK